MQLALIPGEGPRGGTPSYAAPRPKKKLGPSDPPTIGVYLSFDDQLILCVTRVHGGKSKATCHSFPATVALRRSGTPYPSADQGEIVFGRLKAILDQVTGEWLVSTPQFPDREYLVTDLLSCCFQDALKKLGLSTGDCSVVGSVPYYWNDRQRLAMRQMIERNNTLTVKRIQSEESAVCIANGITKMLPRPGQEELHVMVLRSDETRWGGVHVAIEEGIIELKQKVSDLWDNIEADFFDVIVVFGADVHTNNGLHHLLLQKCKIVRGFPMSKWSPETHNTLYRHNVSFRLEVLTFLLCIHRWFRVAKDVQNYIIACLADIHQLDDELSTFDPRFVVARGCELQARIVATPDYTFCIG